MSNFSIKKPFTVFVGVVIVIILGIVSFMNLSTDLLPSIELPYVAIVTTYVGASPEKVEESVSKVIEQGMMGISNIENVTSTSSENYSMVLLEFSGDSNMDSVMIEISQELDVLESNLEEGVSTPIVMQINPDMMPVLMSAVDMENSDSSQITEFVQNNLIQELESVSGVASVDLYGAVQNEIKIKLDQNKIDEINDKMLANVDSELSKTKKELDDAKLKISSGKAELEKTKTEKGKEIAEGLSAIESGRNEITKAEIEISNAEKEMSNKRGELESSLSELAKAETELNNQKSNLQCLQNELSNQLLNVQSQKENLNKRKLELETKNTDGTITLEESFELNLIPENIVLLDATIKGIEEGQNKLNIGLTEMSNKEQELISGKNQITEGLNQINLGVSTITDQRNAIEAKKSELNTTFAMLQVAQSTLTSETTKASTQLDSAEKELNDGVKQFESARDEAYKKASLDGIITVDLASNILKAENFEMPAGYINDDIIVKVGEKFSSIDEIKNLVLFTFDMEGLEEIKLEDLASIEVTNNQNDIYTKVNNNNGLILSFSKQSTASTKDVSEAIQKKMKDLEEKYNNISFTNLMDQGVYIDMIIGSVMQSLVIGGFLAIIILFLFLKEIKPTLIVAISIPVSVVFAIAMMYFSGVTINIMSLSGLALGVGMLVDNSIVVIENIYRLKKEGKEIRESAREGARKVTGAIIASTLTTICVFLPIVFIQGISRQLFTDIGLTIAYSLIASLIVALTVVPAMGSRLLTKVTEKENKFINKLTEGYVKLLEKALKLKILVIVLVIVLLGTSIFLVTRMEIEFIPSVNSNEMSLSIIMPDNSSDEEGRNVSNQIIEKLLTIDEIEKIGAMDMSGSISMFGTGSGISMYIILDEKRDKTNEEIANQIKDLTKDLNCDLDISTSNMDMSAMMESGVSVKIKGNEIKTLKELGADIESKLKNVDGIGEIEGVSENSSQEKLVKVDKNRAMKYGLTVAGVYQVIAGELKEEIEGANIEIDNKEYQLIIQKPDESKLSVDNLMNIELDGKENNEEVKVKLSDISVLMDSATLESISRENNNRYITVSASIKDDASTTQTSRAVEKLLKDYETPNGYKIEIEGENDSVMEYISDLMLMIFVAVIFIYLIMVAQFQSFKLPFIVMFTIPLAFTGGLLALFFTGQTINIIAMLGFLVLAGIVVNNGIVFIDCINQLRDEGIELTKAILQTGKLRLRPILMTALTTILGLLSMALGIGDGAEMTQPLGIVAIGGLLYATLLTLFLVPCLYAIFCKKVIKK